MRVGDFMSRDLVTLPPDASVRDAWRTLQRHRIRLLPVVEDGRLLGVVSLVDVLESGWGWTRKISRQKACGMRAC